MFRLHVKLTFPFVLDRAIAMLPDEDKKEYLEAKEVAPHLVELESDPSRYLRIENFNA